VSQKQAKFFWQINTNVDNFATKMTNSLKLYEMHPFSTSTNSCQRNTVLKADVPIVT